MATRNPAPENQLMLVVKIPLFTMGILTIQTVVVGNGISEASTDQPYGRRNWKRGEMVLAAVETTGYALQYASPRCKTQGVAGWSCI